MKDVRSFEGLHCTNCGAPLQGEFCHRCGQSVHSVLKPAHHMAEEAVETLLHIDSRILHTLPALFLKPGFLTLEYFAGRRVRYIAPFRLMFVLCLLAFFVLHWTADRATSHIGVFHPHAVSHDNRAFERAKTPAEVRAALRRQLAGIDQASHAVGVAGALMQLSQARQILQQQANQRLAELGAAPMPAASLAPPPAASAASPSAGESVGNEAVIPARPVHVAWLPAAVNARLTLMITRWRIIKHGDDQARKEAIRHWLDDFFGALPQTLFVMIPVFALLLKLFYLFKRRLYMEHLIVALHSHAFLFLCLLLGVGLDLLADVLIPHAHWVVHPLHWLERALVLWVLVYLLMMQKRIYHQGWPMTALKYWFIGWFYLWLLLGVLLVAALLGLAH